MAENKLDPLLTEAKQLYSDYAARRVADLELEEVFVNGTFTNRLYDVLGLNVQDSGSKYLLVNLVRAAVIDRTRMISSLPDSKFDVPFTQDPDVALVEQDILINLHTTMWDFWRLKRQLKNAAFNIALKNRALWMLFPDFANKKPMLYSLDPAIFYAEPDYAGDYPRVFLIYEELGRKVSARYPEATEQFNIIEPQGRYEVVEFWDAKERRVWINNIEAKNYHIEHNLGFVPIRYTQDVHIPGTIDNMSNAHHSIAMAENFTDVLTLVSAEQRKRLSAVPYAKGAVDPAQFEKALRGEVVLDLDKDGGEVGFAQPVQGQQGAHQHLQAMDELVRVALNWPRLRSGQIDSSIWTGAGIGAAQSGVSADTLDVRDSIAFDLEWIDEVAIHMFKKMWGNQEHPLIVFEKGQSVGHVKIKPNEDIPNDFRHQLIVSPLGHDQVSKLVSLMQLFGQKIFDKLTVLENIPGANGPEIMRRLEEDVQRDLKTQIAIQQGMAEIQTNAAMQQQAMEQGAVGEPQGLQSGQPPNPQPRTAGGVS